MKRIFYVIGVLLTFGAIYYADAIPPSPSAPPSGSTSITTLGTVTTGTWEGTKIGIGYGGTNATNATDARTNLGLGTLATQNADAINATGGSVTGLTNLGAANLTVTGDTTLGITNIGSTTAGKNLTVNATRSSIFTFDEANIDEDDVTWTMTGTGALVHVSGNTTAITLTTTEAIVADTVYLVTITGTGGGGTATYTLGGAKGSTTIAASGAIAISEQINAIGTYGMTITPTSGCTVSITDITIHKLTKGTGDATIDGNLTLKSPMSIVSGSGNLVYPLLKLYGNYGFFYDSGKSIVGLNTGFITYNGSIRVGSNIYGLGIGQTYTTYLYSDAAGVFAMRNAVVQQIFNIYNTYTDTSNYERLSLTGVAGSSVNIKSETAGTGADNLNILMNPSGTALAGVQSPIATTGGGFGLKVAEAVSATLSGASGSIAVNVPSGKIIRGVQLRVDTAITSGDGGTTWTADYTNTPTTAITSGQAFAKGTKYNALHTAREFTTDTVTITITPNSGTFSGGAVRAVVYYEDLVTLSDAP